jgi:CRISPR-associated protein Cas5h
MEGKFLIFDIWADYAHFKKPYTTTSPLSFSIPPVSTLTGLISAIVGIDKKEYTEYFSTENCQFSVRIINPVKKIRMGLNLINTKKSFNRIEERTQIKTEFLKDPAFRVFFSHNDSKLYNELKRLLEAHLSVYTISLGLSGNIADYNYLGEYVAKKIEPSSFEGVTSVINMKLLEKGDIDFSALGEYFTENIPFWMTKERQVEAYQEIIFERNGKQVLAKPKILYCIEELNEKICIL